MVTKVPIRSHNPAASPRSPDEGSRRGVLSRQMSANPNVGRLPKNCLTRCNRSLQSFYRSVQSVNRRHDLFKACWVALQAVGAEDGEGPGHSDEPPRAAWPVIVWELVSQCESRSRTDT